MGIFACYLEVADFLSLKNTLPEQEGWFSIRDKDALPEQGAKLETSYSTLPFEREQKGLS